MTITTSTSETFYQDIGQGKTLVLLHGWGCDWQIWSSQIRHLSEHFRLIIPDLPIFGQSTVTNDKVWNSQDYVIWLSEFLEQVFKKNEKYVLVGHSFGGKIASLFASSMHPKQLTSLVIVDASGLPSELTSTQTLKSRLIQLIPTAMKKRVNNSVKEKILGELKLSSDYLNANPEQKAVLKKIVHENIAAALPSIEIPTIIIWGATDQDTPIEQGKEFAELIPNAKLKIFDNSGHFPFIDEAVRFNQLIIDELQ